MKNIGNFGTGQNDSTSTAQTTSESSPDAAIDNNNLTNNNATSASGRQIKEHETMTITDTTGKYISQASDIIDIDENKFVINSIDEKEIIKKIQEKTKLDKEKIKRSIKFKKKEPIKDGIEEVEETESIPTAQIIQLGYITKVNGSVIIRLG